MIEIQNSFGKFLCILLLLIPSDAIGQLQPRYEVDSKADAACELNSRYLDSLVSEVKKRRLLVFIIARRNVREKKLVDRARLSSAVSVLSEVKKINSKQIVTGVGEAVRDSKGRLEFYLDNELYLISFAEPGEQPCFTCCP